MQLTPYAEAGAISSGDYGRIAGRLLRTAEDMEEFMKTFPREAEEAAIIARTIISKRLQSDEAAAIRWARSLPPGGARNAALDVLITHLHDSDRAEEATELSELVVEANHQ